MIWGTAMLDENGERAPGFSIPWPVHEVGRNADIFDEDAGRLLKAGSAIVSDSVHLHSNGRDTTGHLEVGFRFHDKDYKPKYQNAFIGLRQWRRYQHPRQCQGPRTSCLHRARESH